MPVIFLLWIYHFFSEGIFVDEESGIPVFIESEKTNYIYNLVERITDAFEDFRKHIRDKTVYLRVYEDLYSEDNIKYFQSKNIKFITRPINIKIKEVVNFINQHKEDELFSLDEKHQGNIYNVDLYGVKQKWMLVRNEDAIKCSSRAVDKSLQTETKKLTKKIGEYVSKPFTSELKAQKELKKFEKLCKFCKIKEGNISKKENVEGENEYNFFLNITIEPNLEYCNEVKINKCFFVIATNDVERNWTIEDLYKDYLSDNKDAREFRFMKDEQFYLNKSLIANIKREQTMLFMMILSMAVYNGLEWKLQAAMQEYNIQLADEDGNVSYMITIAEALDEFAGVSSVFEDCHYQEKEITNLRSQAPIILFLLGRAYEDCYGIEIIFEEVE